MNDRNAKRTTSVLDAALTEARARSRRLFLMQRALLASGAAGMFLVAVRGLVAVSRSGGHASTAIAVGLAMALALSGGLVACGLRARAEAEVLARDILLLEVARDALEHDASPQIELHPYRASEGPEEPVLVLRTDSVMRVFARASSAAEGGAS